MRKKIKNWCKQTKGLHADDLTIDYSNDGDFAYYNDRILIGDIKASEDDYYEFLQLCKELGLKKHWNVNTMCMLHELGHHNTYKNFTKEEEKYDRETRDDLYEIISNPETEDIGLYLYYRILDQEREATRWAVEFANKHPILTNRLDTIITEQL